jgi:hypothetical protein
VGRYLIAIPTASKRRHTADIVVDVRAFILLHCFEHCRNLHCLISLVHDRFGISTPGLSFMMKIRKQLWEDFRRQNLLRKYSRDVGSVHGVGAVDDVQARAGKILLSGRLELGDDFVCEDVILAMIFIAREFDLFPNTPRKNVGKAVAPSSRDAFAALPAHKRPVGIRMKKEMLREISLKVPVCKRIARAVIKEEAKELNEIDV